MAAQKYTIDFIGYWRESNIMGIPSQSGVYCVYECNYNITNKSVDILRLIYIGEAGDVRERIVNHERWMEWSKKVSYGNEPCFSFARIAPDWRERIEAALIFEHKPPVNDEYSTSFPFDETTISITGKTAHLESTFTVERTAI